jgi:hypothetical protein
MSPLGKDATQQAARDASGKHSVQTGRPQLAIAWFFTLSWKAKFALIAVVMFVLYGVINTLLTGLGLRMGPGASGGAAGDSILKQAFQPYRLSQYFQAEGPSNFLLLYFIVVPVTLLCSLPDGLLRIVARLTHTTFGFLDGKAWRIYSYLLILGGTYVGFFAAQPDWWTWPPLEGHGFMYLMSAVFGLGALIAIPLEIFGER